MNNYACLIYMTVKFVFSHMMDKTVLHISCSWHENVSVYIYIYIYIYMLFPFANFFLGCMPILCMFRHDTDFLYSSILCCIKYRSEIYFSTILITKNAGSNCTISFFSWFPLHRGCTVPIPISRLLYIAIGILPNGLYS